MMFVILLINLLFLDAKVERATIEFDNKKQLQIEIAKDLPDRNKGLMGRTSMAENSGMLFVFEKPQQLSFWMKNTYIPLSIGYFDKNKILKEIYKMKAQSIMEREQDLKGYKSQCSCKYALEVNQGWFEKHKITPGARFQFFIKQKNKKTN